MKSFLPIPLAALAAGVFFLQPAKAALIFQENFDGNNTTNLNGTAPDVRPGSQLWTSSTTVVIHTDGSIATTGGASGWLPYTFASNQIYTLTATVDIAYQTSSTTPAGIGFTTNSPLSGAAVNLADSGDYGILQARRGGSWAFFEGDDNNSTPTATGTGLFNSSQTNYEIKLVLDTSGTNWTLAGYMNGVQVDMNGAGVGLIYTYSSNPALTGVGISYASNSYVFQSFSLSADAVPEPGSAVLFAAGGMALLWGRRRVKVNP